MGKRGGGNKKNNFTYNFPCGFSFPGEEGERKE